jgi:uncharacterized protein YggU (UPF0235/DUF167 family)
VADQQTFYAHDGEVAAVRVKAKPGSRRDALAGVAGSELVVEVRATAERGRANEAVARVLAVVLGVPRGSIALRRGAASRHKVFLVPREALAALRKLGGSASSKEGS